MSLSRLLAKRFSKRVQDKGRAYFFSNAVKIDNISERFAEATVRGTEDYEVDLELQGKTLVAYCSCPFVDRFLEPCKHIWATILKVDAQNGMQNAQRQGALRFRL